MKRSKILSLLLSVLMIVSSISCLTVVSSAAVVDGGYEYGENDEILSKYWELDDSGVLTIYKDTTPTWLGHATEIKKVVLEAGVTTIPSGAFNGCVNLTELNTIKAASDLKYILNSAFVGCSSFKNLKIDAALEIIDAYAFQQLSSLETVEIASVAEVGDYAFYDCNNLKSVHIGGGLVVDGVGKNIFKSCDNLTNVVFENGTLAVGYAMFEDCVSLVNISLPDSLVEIGERAFDDCRSLTTITVPDSVENVGRYAFHGCTSATTAYIGHKAENIGEYAFYGCTSLESVEIACAMRVYPEGMFMDCTALSSIKATQNVETIGANAFKNCTSLTTYVIPLTTTMIGASAFDNTGISEIVIPFGVTDIGAGAFTKCDDLVNIIVDDKNPNYVSVDGALYDVALETLISCPAGKTGTYTVYSNTKTILDDAFIGCDKLSVVEIPDSVTTIANTAFNGCSADLVIKAGCSSAAADYAKKRGIEFDAIHSDETTWVETQVPTCETAGTKEKRCAACDFVIESVVVDPIGHNYNSGVVTVNPTCEDDGVMTYSCVNEGCSSSYTKTIAALGHNYDDGTVILEATCDNDGIKRFRCKNEGCVSTYDVAIPATGHSYDDGTVKVAATCEANGEIQYKCKDENCNYSYTDVIPAIGHKYNEGVITTPATCEADGVKTYTCTRTDCGATYTEGIPATSHKYDAGVITKNPTVKADGERTFTCTNAWCAEDHPGHTLVVSIPNIAFAGIIATNDGAYADENGDFVNLTWFITDSYELYILADDTATEWAPYKHDIITATISGNATTVANGSFAKMAKLETANILLSNGTVEAYAFQECPELKTVITGSIAEVGDYAFNDCKKLEYVEIYGGLAEGKVGVNVFNGCEKLTTVKIGNGSIELGYAMFKDCSSLAEINLPKSLIVIGDSAFDGTALETIEIKTDVKSIGKGAFTNCPNLKSINVDNKNDFYFSIDGVLYSMEFGTLMHCPAAKKGVVKVWNGTETIAEDAFIGCKGITMVEIPDSVIAIADNAFNNCATALVIKAGCTTAAAEFAVARGIKFEAVHSAESKWIETLAPTCTTKGEESRVCALCEYAFESVAIDELGHEYDSGVVTKKATCEADGVKTYTCTRTDCGATYTEGIPATSHKYDEGVITKNPTVKADGERTFTCTNAWCTEDHPGHTLVVSIPNIAFAGIIATNEGAYVDENGDLVNLTWYITDTYELYILADDTAAEWAPYKHDIITATISGNATTVANGSFEKMAKLETANILLSDGTVEAYAFQECPELKKVITGSIAQVGDYAFNDCKKLEYVEIYGGLAEGKVGGNIFNGCENLTTVKIGNGSIELGYAMFKDCSSLAEINLPKSLVVIGDSAFDGTALETIEIKTDVKSIGKGAFTNCPNLKSINVDNKNDFYFSIDGVLYSMELGTLMHCPAAKKGVVKVWNGTETIAEDAFIGCKGITMVEIPDSVTAIADNAFNNCATALVIKAGCTTAAAEFAVARGIKFEAVHSAESKWIETLAPTCTTKGEKSRVCALCEYAFESVAIDELGHEYDSGIVTKKATCEEDGVVTFTCVRTDCGEFYTEVIPATEHRYDTGEVIINPTCENEGTKRFTCQNEGCYDYYDITLKALNHVYDKGVVTTPATCENDGVMTYTCTRTDCGDFYTEVIPAIGHAYDKGVVTTPATCDADGVMTYTCANCGDSYTEVIPAIGHNYVESVIKTATCVENGKNRFTCTNCGDTYDVATTGEHKLYESNVTVKPTCTDEGKTGKMCAICKKFVGAVETIPATGHDYRNGTCGDCGHKDPNYKVVRPATPKMKLVRNEVKGLTVTWTAVDGAKSYRVYRRGAGEKYWTYIGSVNTNSCLDTKAATGKYWRYTVRAVGETGLYSGYENGIYIKRVDTPHMRTIANTSNGIKVTWSSVSNAKEYRVYRRGAGGTWVYLGITTSTSYVDTAVKNAHGQYYRYTVRAVDGYYSNYETGIYIKRA